MGSPELLSQVCNVLASSQHEYKPLQSADRNAVEYYAARFGRLDLAMEKVSDGIERSVEWLLGQQHEQGYWCGELEADSMLEADYIFMHTLLGTGDKGKMERVHQRDSAAPECGRWMEPVSGRAEQCELRCEVLSGAEADGLEGGASVMVKARENVLSLGGVTQCNTFTKMYLCSLGQYDYDAVPAVPPEMILFPNWFYFNIYEISAWSRAILVPLSIIYAKKPFKKLAAGAGDRRAVCGWAANADLHLEAGTRKHIFSWRNFLSVYWTGWRTGRSGCIFGRCGRRR